MSSMTKDEINTSLFDEVKRQRDEIERLQSQNEDLALALKCAYMDEGCSEDEAIRAVAAITRVRENDV